MTGQRARIQRQIRLQFIYPLIYVCMWIFPFTLHCLQYQDRYAQHPPFALSILVVLCLTSMGTVDCLIFSLRERPWRHMPRSDHTFWGSFVCWHGNRHGEYAQGSRQGSHASDVDSRRSSANAGGAVHPTAESSRRVSVFIPRASTAPTAILPGRTFSRYSIRPPKLLSGPTEQEKNAAEMARERLRVEQEDRRQARIRANEKAAIAAAAAVERVALAEEEKKECAGGGVCSQSTGNGRLDLEEISADEKATTGVADRAALSKQEQERDTSGSLYSQSTGGVQLDLEQIEADEETMATVMAGHTALASYAQEEETSGSSYSQSTGGNPRIVELGDTTDGGDSGNETSSMPEKFEEV
ncbi:hypothetical protein BU16DRAFT_100712 [Lophium mytilinum]|uniref:G protein-coupled receptor GPR1/2/3 C-terminal domain-containing protein n=1 Tax=Lophium mytilinum TaxID=390894 RepID=A0A6A6QIU4_9PEZI|nr:hypothetical protein BU16DRAFT_100712 [Lophium mytilinum]